MKKNRSELTESQKAKQRYKDYKKGKNSKRKHVLIIAVIVIILTMVIGAVIYIQSSEVEDESEFNQGDLVIERVTETQNGSEESLEMEETLIEEVEENAEALNVAMTEEEIEDIVDSYMETMNIEAKAGQLFLITPEELTGIGIAVQAGETTKTMIKKYGVGGIVLSEQNFEVIDQMKLMVSNIKVYSTYPIFMAMDESGAVRITNTNNTLEEVGFNMALVETELYLLTEEGNESVNQELNIVDLEEGSVLELLQGEADMIMVYDGFESAYNTVVNAVRSGELEETELDEKVRKILRYKVENEI